MSHSPKFQDHAFDSKLHGRRDADGVEIKSKEAVDEKTALKEVFGRFGGYQIHRVPYRNNKQKEVPAWAIKDESLRTVLLTAFPRLHTNLSQRKAAARWAQVIQLYYRQGWTETEVADEMMEKVNSIRCLVYHIRKVAEKAKVSQ